LSFSSLLSGEDEDLDPMPEDPQELAADAQYLWNKSISTVCTQVITYTINGVRKQQSFLQPHDW